jgi:hypothetical protein
MALYLKVEAAGDNLFYLLDHTVLELDHFITAGTDQVVVVAVIEENIMGGTGSLVHRPNEAQFRK